MSLRVAVRFLLAAAATAAAVVPGFSVGADSEPGQGKFLIASTELKDPNFKWTVVLLLDYGPHGAMGLVINRPTQTRLFDILPEVDALRDSEATVFVGGPVQTDRVMTLVRSGEPSEDVHHVFADIYASRSQGLIQRLSNSKPATSFRVYLGYAGWAPGQLDREVERGDWYIVPADPEIVFGEGSTRIWRDLIPRPGDWTRRPTGASVSRRSHPG